MTRLYLYAAIALVMALLIAGAVIERAHYGATRYAAGEMAGRDAVLADDARAAAQLQQQRAQLDQFSAVAGTALHSFLGKQLPAIEAQSHASVESIRTIYRDRPVPADQCARPAGVQAELDQAVDAANAAAASDVHL
ncbi:MAG: hypothetical protein BGP10_12480 [Rhodanobacter sp. 68-29]|nr:hypothetical protein [Rhodanobacter sp.]ODV28002.1 MAG: hypothetical protein ABT19_00400 [Rhodanobacter sp. SCN 68-63]OJY60706.1 MAG: hypothetical protein BGP10_12480 [Rhodanobacter sp. 68-29]